MNKTIEKILIGKVFKFNPASKQLFVIVGVRTNSYHNFIEVLVGNLYFKFKTIEIHSWHRLNNYDIHFHKRSSKEIIKKCLKTNPDKLKYHVGEKINIEEYKIFDNKYTKYYEKYLTERTNN